ncbi:MAG: alpha-D-ribose 1-methylphosphonate 5-triphosphate diphosphatase [Crocosphaera sp.]|nr:alpha-D-ribose 1-methylphosphonate 5-triphosphate diphosphatase [Crocosphaera sp.]
MKTYFTNAQIILKDQVLESASLLVEDGVITTINPNTPTNVKEINLQGQYLMPGMIDAHCDAIEKEIEPRANTFFPLEFAIAQIDRKNAIAGITTPFHSISFAHEELGVRNNEMAAEIVRGIHQYQPFALVDNRVHCRYEITDPTSLPILLDLLGEDSVHLFSLMDHTPGQGQFKDLQAYRDYLRNTYKKSEAETDVMVAKKLDNAQGAQDRIKTLVSKAHLHNVAIASHDDDTEKRIEIMANLGITISEFPINLPTAQKAIEMGLHTIFGAPNILRGKSQSGSMKAISAITNNVASCLCSDYSPATLLTAAFRLPTLAHLTLPEAISLVTANPAKALLLGDRGEISVEKRADLIVVNMINNLPQVTQTWVNGVKVYGCYYGN